MQIVLSMTLGDVIVAGAVVISVISGYHAVKNQLRDAGALIAKLTERVDRHDGVLEIHGKQLVRLFARRQSDRDEPMPQEADF